MVNELIFLWLKERGADVDNVRATTVEVQRRQEIYPETVQGTSGMRSIYHQVAGFFLSFLLINDFYFINNSVCL